MKPIQTKLLLAQAFCLCCLCAWQWYVQSVQQVRIQNLGQFAAKQAAALQEATNTLALMDHQIAERDNRITAFKHTVETNDTLVASLRHEIQVLRVDGEEMTRIVGTYQKAVDELTAKLKTGYDGIQKQNDAIKKLISQRDELVTRLNDTVRERNGIVERLNESLKDREALVVRYNELVKQVERMQKDQERVR